MNWLDIVVLVATAIAAFIGWFVGVLRAIVGLAGLVVGVVVASRFHAGLADSIISKFISSPSAAKVVAFLIIVVLVLLLAMVLGGILKKVLSLLMLGWTDKVVGLALGVVVCLAVFSALLSAVYANSLFDLRSTMDSSFLGSFLLDQYGSLLEALKLVPRDFGSPLQ
ncbi:MAG: CvpA family protein [Chloroflexota bacterium]|nr:CvpA family protein [Chloroflexota bacterium]